MCPVTPSNDRHFPFVNLRSIIVGDAHGCPDPTTLQPPHCRAGIQRAGFKTRPEIRPTSRRRLDVSTVQRWTDISDDPHDPEVIAWRRRRLTSARRAPVRNRVAYLTSLARGQKVLDVGAAAHTVDRHSQADWLHQHLAGAARECLGVDILEHEVSRLQEAGYNIRMCNVLDPHQRRSLEGQYDVMVCGELIEHLVNPGALLEAAGELLVPGGRIVLTTPNAFSLWVMARHALGRPRDSVDHVSFLYPSGMAEMAERHGLVLDAYRGTLLAGMTWKHHMAFRMRRAFAVVSPEIFCTTMIYEIIRPVAQNTRAPRTPTRQS